MLAILERTLEGFHLLKQLEGVDNSALAFSPDGNALAYVSGPSQQTRIILTYADVPIIELPPSSRSTAWAFSWSPDGASLAYVDVDGVHIVNRDGSGSRLVEGLPEGILRLSWAPKGTSLILGVAKTDEPFVTFLSLPILNTK